MADEPKQPWWKGSLAVALIGVAIPAATFVQGWWQKNRELALQEKQQMQQIRAQYMGMLAEAGVEGIETLADFIADTEQDPTIREWAEKQRDKARQKIDDLNKKIESEQQNVKAAQDAADAAEQREQETRERLKELRAQSKQDKAEKAQAEAAAAAARAALANAQANVLAKQGRLTRVRQTLNGRLPLKVDGGGLKDVSQSAILRGAQAAAD
jgi:acetyl/propionyl-CoA carboxylase alpha subunit